MISKQFIDISNFLHCVGSVDGKYIIIQSPISSKSFFRIVLFAFVNTDYNFLFVDWLPRKDLRSQTMMHSPVELNRLHT